MKKFSEYSKNQKIVRIINYIFSLLMLITSIVYTVIGWKNLTPDRYMQTTGPWFVVLTIYILETVFRSRVSNGVLTFYNVYIFFASILGTTFHLYTIIPYYDKIIHCLFGYVGGILGLFFLIKLGDYKKMSIGFSALMILFVSMGCASIWEIIEYSCDHLFHAYAQGSPVNGIVSVEDTMWDIIMNCIGMVVFEIHYLIHRFTKKNLLLESIEKDFANN